MPVSVFLISTSASGTIALLWSVMRPDMEAFSVCAHTYCANGASRQPTATDKQTKNPGTRRHIFFFMATPLSQYSGQVRDLPQSSITFSDPSHCRNRTKFKTEERSKMNEGRLRES